MNLYDIAEQYLALENMDIDDKTLADTLEMIDGEFEDKAINICHVLANMNADIEMIDSEILRLNSKAKALAKRESSLKEYLKNVMVQSENFKIESPLFTISTIKPKDIVTILDADKLNSKFLVKKTTFNPDKKMIKQWIDNGEEVEGAILTKGDWGLKIK